MSKQNSSKLPYILGASAIGGAVGYLFFTDSGRRVRDSIFNAENAAWLPDRIEDARKVIERRGGEITGTIQDVVDRAKESIDVGSRAYHEKEQSLHSARDWQGSHGRDVVGNIHRAIDNLNRTFQTIQSQILDPLNEVAAIAEGVDRGVRRLMSDRPRSRRTA